MLHLITLNKNSNNQRLAATVNAVARFELLNTGPSQVIVHADDTEDPNVLLEAGEYAITSGKGVRVTLADGGSSSVVYTLIESNDR